MTKKERKKLEKEFWKKMKDPDHFCDEYIEMRSVLCGVGKNKQQEKIPIKTGSLITIYGFNKSGNRISEEVVVPEDGSVVISKNVFFGERR